MRHEKCGYEYEVTPDSFLQGTRCPNCYGNPLKTTEEFIDEVKKREKDNYTVLGKYTGAHNKIKMRHEKCGHIYSVTPDLFLSSETRCPNCFGTFKKSNKEFKEDLFKMYGEEFEVLEDYINAKTKLLVRHKCGYEYKVKPNNILSGKGCPECNRQRARKKHSKGLSQFKKDVKEIVGNEYSVLGDYINAKTPIKMKHNSCGHIYKEKPDNFLSKESRCPNCYRKGRCECQIIFYTFRSLRFYT